MIKAKQTTIIVSDFEARILQDYVKTSPLMLIRFKSQAVLMARNDISITSISKVFDRQTSTILDWLSDWQQRHLASIFTGHTNNKNANKLTAEQQEEIQQALQSPPSDFGLPKGFWDVPQLKTYIKATFDIIYESERSYHYLLEFSNLSFKYPDKFDCRRNDVFVTERMANIRHELAPLLVDDSYEVFSCDEVRIDQEAIARRAWITKGEKTIVKVNRTRQSQSYIGFLNQKTGQYETFSIPWQKSSEILKAYELFLAKHPNKKIIVVWDNTAFHRSKEIRSELKVGGILERVHLIAMPPYAPDHNPIEHIWKETKQNISNIQHDTFEQTKEAFTGFIGSRVFNYTY
ncbi:MAG: hypothetical protein PWQ10_315 [Patescibacteria group bacterium]|nr:hypothetical protein [Patescibacteria group bacterium]